MGTHHDTMMWSSATSAVRVYCCAHERNRPYRHELECHFAPLKNQGQILTWHNDDILPGADHQLVNEYYFNSADLLLLLISHYFFSSEVCWNIMGQSLKRHEAGCAHLIPVLVSPVDYEITPLGKLRILPRGKPLTRWPNRDEAYVDVVKGVREIMQTLPLYELRAKRAPQENIQQRDRVYQQAAVLDSMDPYFYKTRGDLLFGQQQYEEALAAYDVAIRLKPDYSLAYRGKAYVLDELALITYEQFKRLAMQSVEIALMLLRYEELKQRAAQSFEMATVLDASQKRKGDLE